MNYLKTIILFLTCALFTVSCGSKKDFDFASAEVALVANEGYETATLRSTGYGNSKDEALYQAEKLAFENLFFRGFPNSNFRNPIIGLDRNAIEKKHPTFFDEFYGNTMRTFISSSYQSTPFQKSKGTHITTVDLTINVNTLKKYLEDKGIVRRFGL
ncbi:hypothetical protein EAX61_10340 [Dokdonia sinensis]|uniref:Uncharacterized protein n=1 Tax=Dokdonia sinensis TaxID=2479847 RepID=A0A3M0G044_9FLAO|nr:hypothetical protein [Dokdonia sinensis]RMB58008.1 hypothetical protein EAX61_10340 [Dokdonia sinensis]